MIAMVSASETRVDWLDYALFAGTLIICGVFFFQGGWVGIAGACGGVVYGYLRPTNPHARIGSVLKTAFAAAWAGIMIGGVVNIGV